MPKSNLAKLKNDHIKRENKVRLHKARHYLFKCQTKEKMKQWE